MKEVKKVLPLVLIPVFVLFIQGSVFAMGGEQNTASPGGLGFTSTELNIAYTGTPQPAEKEYIIDAFAKSFETKYGVKVNIEFISQADGIRKIESEQDTQNIVTDVVYVDTANMAPYVNGGWMEDAAGMIHQGTTLTAMYDDTTNVGDARYFVPNTFDVYILAANVDALKYLPAGLDRQSVIDGITWEQYVEWAINIARGEGIGKTMIPANNQGSQLLYPMAGMTIAYGGGFPDFSSQGFKEALDLIADMAEGNAFYPEQAQYTAPTDPMLSDDVWLTFAHMSPIGIAYNAAPNEWIIGAAPKGSKGSGSTSGAWCWGVQKDAPHKDLAQLWIDYVTTAENNYAFCVNLGGFLSPINEVAAILDSDDVVMTAGINMLDDTIVAGVPSTEYQDWNAVKLLYHEAFNRTVSAKEVPPDLFLQELEAKCADLRD